MTQVRRCLVCDAVLLLDSPGERYCATHQRAFEVRQAEGVAATALDACYGDTLATWRDRPARLADLPAAHLRFRHRDGAWLLFFLTTQVAGGISGQGLRADWLAVQSRTGAVQRYTQTPEIDVWFDLHGRRPAPAEQGPAQAWGRSEPGVAEAPRPRRAGRGAPHQPDLAAVVATTRLPLYGVPADASDLALAGFQSQHLPDHAEVTQLTFSNHRTVARDVTRTEETLGEVRSRLMDEAVAWREQHSQGRGWAYRSTRATLPGSFGSDSSAPAPPPVAPPVPTVALELHHAYHLAYDLGVPQALEQRLNIDPIGPALLAGLPPAVRAALSETRCMAFCVQAHGVLRRYAPDHIAGIATGPSQLLRRTLVVAGKPFAAELLAWAGEHPLCASRLDRDETRPVRSVLTGAAYGIRPEGMPTLLEHLVVINDQPELLARYQADLEEVRRSRLPPDARP